MALSGDRAKLYDEEAKRKSGIAADEPSLVAALAAVQSSTAAAWLCARLDASGKRLELVSHGLEGGLPALRPHLADDAVSWAVFSFSPGFPHGEGSRKLASLTCVGPAVGAMKKGKVALQKAGVFIAMGNIAQDAGIFQGVAEATDETIVAELRRNMPKSELVV
jgi:hypothetical protein